MNYSLVCKLTDEKKQKIPKAYLYFPVRAEEPPSVLCGFTDVDLQPGESKTASITLSRYDLSMWDVLTFDRCEQSRFQVEGVQYPFEFRRQFNFWVFQRHLVISFLFE